MSNSIDLIDESLLRVSVGPGATGLSTWVEPIKAACRKFQIDTPREVACFLAQSAHESNGFKSFVENLNYSAQRLTQVWPKRFPSIATANLYAHNPEKLANNVYANRMGNGPESSGDGWKFRGSGLFQLTGRANYTRFAQSVGKTPEAAADWIRQTNDGAAMSAAWFFHDHGIDKLAETAGVEDETRAINGGVLGLPDRKAHFDAVLQELLRRGAK
jgi:putative chitinase